MTQFEALYGKRCKSRELWDQVGEIYILGLDMLEYNAERVQLIRKKLLTTQSLQKSYADKMRRNLEFEVSDHVFLKVTLVKRVSHFEYKGKLAPHYIGPFEILECIGAVVYHPALSSTVAYVHNIFFVSMLCNYMWDPPHVL